MCTTNLCFAYFILAFVVFGWAGALVLIIGKSSRDQGNSYIINPLVNWVDLELINPVRCFRAEVLRPIINDFKITLNDWNKGVGSKPELNF